MVCVDVVPEVVQDLLKSRVNLPRPLESEPKYCLMTDMSASTVRNGEKYPRRGVK